MDASTASSTLTANAPYAYTTPIPHPSTHLNKPFFHFFRFSRKPQTFYTTGAIGYVMTNKIRLALYTRKSGAQSITYYGTVKNVYRIVKPEEFRLPKNEDELAELEEKKIVEFVKPEREKYLYYSSSELGGFFEIEKIKYYTVEPPVLIERISIHDAHYTYSYEVVNEDLDEETDTIYDKPFSIVIKEAEVIDNRTNIPIDELARLKCRRTSYHNERFECWESYELENGCSATLFFSRLLSADRGYRIDYTKLLRIYPPPQK